MLPLIISLVDQSQSFAIAFRLIKVQAIEQRRLIYQRWLILQDVFVFGYFVFAAMCSRRKCARHY